ncbi:hypothetical protein L226DRAFT_569440 [Lentinus tigrinus ALCF2SS1-7]|uniref:uncharacterized protein n=1 Tax=Lentinus tigrinus ALCF2SS1-7 TaxID=1328758 RepID=UPI0011660A20|nr:hypothetical protein L226DRAFT_569440 [Lentinus tigrinus ALCF2SS1-7]
MPHNKTKRFLNVLGAITAHSKNRRPSLKWSHLTTTFQTKFNCTVKHVTQNKYKLIPPPPGDPNWPFPQRTLHIYKPDNGTYTPQDVSRLRRLFHNVFGWGPDTFKK